MGSVYWPRLVDGVLHKALDSAGVVLIEGPNGCGKSTTAAQAARSYLHLRYPWHRGGAPAEANFAAITNGPAPRMFSECQAVGGLVEAAAAAAKSRSGQYVLTQSVAQRGPLPPNVRRLRMRPMSLYESGESSGKVSLRQLFHGSDPEPVEASLTVDEAAFAMVRGGWPGMLDKSEPGALRGAGEQMGTLIGLQLGRLEGLYRDADRIGALMRALSTHIFASASVRSIRSTAAADGIDISEQTASQCLRALAANYLVDDIPAWHPILRTGVALRSAPKRQLIDPSLACAVMGLSPADLVSDVQWFSRLFKSTCARDLRTYAGLLDGQLLHYRDARRLKADSVVILPDGRWAAFEMELDVLASEPAVSRLLKLRDKVDTEQMGEPSFLAVLTLSGSAYRRRDGVHVIPISVLGP